VDGPKWRDQRPKYRINQRIEKESNKSQIPKKGTKKKEREKKVKSKESASDSKVKDDGESQRDNMEVISGFLRAAGDELVMRCVLFPELMAVYGETSFLEIASICGMISAGQNMLHSFASKDTFTLSNMTRVTVIESAAGSLYCSDHDEF